MDEGEIEKEISKYMSKASVVAHIESLIKFDVGEKVFVFSKWRSEVQIPEVQTIAGILIGSNYGDKNNTSPYSVEFIMKGDYKKNGTGHYRIDQEYCRKYSEKIAKICTEYHDFFKKMGESKE